MQKILITDEERDIIHTRRDNSLDKNALVDKLIKLKNDYWIACDCKQNAFLIICSLRNKIYLRCKKIDYHLSNCIFVKKNITLTKSSTHSSIILPLKQFNIYKIYNDLSASDDLLQSSTLSFKSLSKLGQVLYTIMEDSKVNIIDEEAILTIIKQLEAVTQSFRDPDKVIYPKIPLGDYYEYFLNEKKLKSAELKLSIASYFFPSFVRPYMLFTGIAKAITSNSFTLNKDGKIFQVKNKITTPSTWINTNTSAPYFLLTSAILNDENRIELDRAFAMPILSTSSLMPVESSYERTALKTILSATGYCRSIIIKKPLFDIFDDNLKLRYRPDFIIYQNSKKIFVEVLGSRDKHYLEHKLNIAALAKQNCDCYISVKGFDFQNEYSSFKKNLHDALSGFKYPMPITC